MRQDFIEKHPEAAKGWIKAEIEALQIMEKDPMAVAKMVMKETQGYTPRFCGRPFTRSTPRPWAATTWSTWVR